MNIADFQAEFKRRSALTLFERINEDSARIKAAKTQAFQDAGGWWLDTEKWEHADVSVLSRPTEILAFRALGKALAPNHTAVWMHFLRDGWQEAREVVLKRQQADRLERVRRLRLRRPMGALAIVV